MNTETGSIVRAMLSQKLRSLGRPPLDDALWSYYETGLAAYDDALLVRAVTAAVYNGEEKWFPELSVLRRKIWEMASPLPDPDTAWRDVVDKMGYLPERPLIHPLVKTVADDLGGLMALYRQHRDQNTPLTLLRNQFETVYVRRAQQWQEAVGRELEKPPPRRDPRYFPVPVGTTFTAFFPPEPKALPPARPLRPKGLLPVAKSVLAGLRARGLGQIGHPEALRGLKFGEANKRVSDRTGVLEAEHDKP